MKVHVDTDRCVAAGQCVLAAAEVFDQNDTDGTVVLLDADPPADQLAAVRDAVTLCPAAAIILDEQE